MKKVLRQCKYLAYRILPLSAYLKLNYFIHFHRFPNLQDPTRFSEKIYCLKVLNRSQTDLIQRAYDKVNVRGYIKEKLGKEYCASFLNTLYGVYSNANEINFDELPSSFVLKISQSSGSNIICPDKTKLNVSEAKRTLNKWITIANGKHFSEEGYIFDGNAVICCEKFLRDKNGNIPYDIRVYCFNGEPRFFVCDVGTTLKDGSHGDAIVRNVYDLEWNLQSFNLGRPRDPRVKIQKPNNLDEIIRVSRVLSEDFKFVRVDLYDIDGKLVFGELTWIPMGGSCVVEPDYMDYELGSLLNL